MSMDEEDEEDVAVEAVEAVEGDRHWCFQCRTETT